MNKVFSVISVCMLQQTMTQQQPGYYHTEGDQYGLKVLRGSLRDTNTDRYYQKSSTQSLSRYFKPRPAELDIYERGSDYTNQQIYGRKERVVGDPINRYSGGGKFNQPGNNIGYLQSSYKKASTFSTNYGGYNQLARNVKKPYGYKVSEDPYSEPANYEFSYLVIEPAYGVKFGHEETRKGEVAKGIYHVLLPDGRTQLVEYVADEEGFKPRITYRQENHNSGYRYKKAL